MDRIGTSCAANLDKRYVRTGSEFTKSNKTKELYHFTLRHVTMDRLGFDMQIPGGSLDLSFF
jgi:hypothetical protein